MPAIFHHITHCRLLSYTAVRLTIKGIDKPHAMVGLNIFAVDTDEEAQRLATTLQQQFLNLMRGNEYHCSHPLIIFMTLRAITKYPPLRISEGLPLLAALKR